jgi:hypothetical protein
MGDHIVNGEFQSDKYPACPRGKVPLSVKDATAQDLLWKYAQRRRPVDAGFSKDLETCLLNAGFKPAQHTDLSEKLHELALSITRGDLRRPWSVQTSNSFRRIGTDRGDGDVLCAVTQPADGQPDLHAAPDVLNYIVAAHPFAILQLIRERDSARHALHFLRHKIAGHDRVFQGPLAKALRCEWDSIQGGLPNEAGDLMGDASTEHPPIASYALGQRVTFHSGRGDHWHPGIVTRLESGLRPDGSVHHTIFVSATRDLPDGEWEHAGAYRFEDHDAACVRPA